MRRRDFITRIASAAVVWPLPVRAQQSSRRIGVLMSTAAEDPEGQARHAAFVDGLRQLGQIEGRNLQIDTRWPVATPLAANLRRNWLVWLRTSLLLLVVRM